ncbi:MAG: Nudix family hydrolase [Motiliproteus sp.]|nr:Nudix family hydrolase [Motiliproteus sp.]MCW9052243.1 Nudix family hydrolase [Motiliproteus sp.]
MTKAVHVAAAAIFGSDGRLLITRRAADVHQGGFWEFPGGKVETDESVEQALCRELQEELGIEPTRYQPLIQIPFSYPDKTVLLDVWRVTEFEGQPAAMEQQPMRWVAVDELDRQQFPAANRAIIDALQLPDHYMITGDQNGGDQAYIERCHRALKSGVAMVQFRSKSLSNNRAMALLKQLQPLCREHNALLIVNGRFSLAEAAQADGVHLTGKQLKFLDKSEREIWTCNPSWWVGASCHDQSQLQKAAELGVRYVSLSPVLATATHPEETPLGWDAFESLVKQASIPVYALGGMDPEQLAEATGRGGQGIAAIRCYWG